MEKNKKAKKQPRSAALISGNPNDIIVIEPPIQPKVYQTEAVKKAISYIKSKSQDAGTFEYMAPSEKKDLEQSAIEKQPRKIRDNAFRKVVSEAGALTKIATSPIKATGIIAKGAIGTASTINKLATPAGIASTISATANTMANIGNTTTASIKSPSRDSEQINKERIAQMKIKTKSSQEDLAQKKLQTKKIAANTSPTSTSNTTPSSLRSMREWKIHSYLSKRAIESGIPEEILEQVFERGLISWNAEARNTAEQVAMQRVNSFIAKGKTFEEDIDLAEKRRGLWDNIHAKRARIKAGSGERMRHPGSEGAPTKQNFVDAAEEVKRPTAQEKFKAGLKKAGYDPDAGAKRLLDLIAKQKKERQEHEAKYKSAYEEVDFGSVTEEGGAGDIGTDKLANKYKKDTPGQALSRMIRARRKANTPC